MANASGSSSMSGMFSGLLREIGGLVRAEINLATTEMTGKAFRVGKEVGKDLTCLTGRRRILHRHRNVCFVVR